MQQVGGIGWGPQRIGSHQLQSIIWHGHLDIEPTILLAGCVWRHRQDSVVAERVAVDKQAHQLPDSWQHGKPELLH